MRPWGGGERYYIQAFKTHIQHFELSQYLSEMAAMPPFFSALEFVEIVVLFFGNPSLDSIGNVISWYTRHEQVLTNVHSIWQMLIHMRDFAFLSVTLVRNEGTRDLYDVHCSKATLVVPIGNFPLEDSIAQFCVQFND